MPKRVKAKRYNGLLEWITERDGHEFMVTIDRGFLKDKLALIGIKEKFIKELNLPNDRVGEKKFNTLLQHLFQSSGPTPEALADEKYVQFVQDAVDLYGMLHNRYIRTPEGKYR